MKKHRLVVFGGTGWMGQAMLLPALSAGFLSPDQLTVVNRNRAELPGYSAVSILTDSEHISPDIDVVLFSVRPVDFPACHLDCSDRLVISIMAGVSVDEIKAQTGASRIIRAMPNAAAECAESYTPYIVTPSVTDEDKMFVQEFFCSFGDSDCLPSEDAFNYYVALTGSGHGTLAFFAASMIESAIEQGLDPKCAEKGVRQLFKGVGKLIAEEDNSPITTVKRVVDYAGTTACLVTTLQASGVADKIQAALLASYNKASSKMTKNEELS